jgi:hypothetical protein
MDELQEAEKHRSGHKFSNPEFDLGAAWPF